MTTIEISSVGQLAQILQRHVSEVRRACETLGVSPAFRINCVDHYSSQDCERLAAHFRRVEEPDQ